MKLLLILLALMLSSCSTYTWTDHSDCKEKVGTLGKCREVK